MADGFVPLFTYSDLGTMDDGVTPDALPSVFPPDPTLNLLSATRDGPLELVLEFDRPPAGDVDEIGAYAITGASHIPTIVAVAEGHDPNPLHVYSYFVRLTFASQAKADVVYTVTVTGLLGPCDEALGVAAASWAGVAALPQVIDAGATPGQILVAFDLPIDMATIGAPSDWTLLGSIEMPTITGVALVAGGRAVALAITGDVLEGTSIRAPSTLTDLAGNAIDPAHREAVVAGFVPAPVFGDVTGNARDLWVGPSGEALVESWSPLPSDPTDEDEMLDRALVCCLGTDRAATDRDALPASLAAVPYRGGCYADFYAPDPLDSRGWFTYGLPPTEDTADRVAQLRREDLAPFVAEGYLAAVSVIAAATVDGLDIVESLTKPDGRQSTRRPGA